MQIKAPKTASLLELLPLLDPQCSKNTLRSWIEKGRISVDGKIVKKGSIQVTEGQLVALGKRTEFIQAGVEILYEDKHLVVVNKPEGLLTVATDFELRQTLHHFLKRRRQRVFPVHRLDRETSGVLVFAYTEEAREHLKKLFQSHDIERVYVAIVDGKIAEQKGTWESHLKEGDDYVVREAEFPEDGRLAITHYQVMRQNERFSAIQLTLQTGRKNQIRVHCKAAKHPIVGDVKYGSLTNPIKRVCLHAHKLGFTHPETGKKMSFISPVPETFSRIV
jgi:23S rRNA pseudouridine1911/1915/1917 synthase